MSVLFLESTETPDNVLFTMCIKPDGLYFLTLAYTEGKTVLTVFIQSRLK